MNVAISLVSLFATHGVFAVLAAFLIAYVMSINALLIATGMVWAVHSRRRT